MRSHVYNTKCHSGVISLIDHQTRSPSASCCFSPPTHYMMSDVERPLKRQKTEHPELRPLPTDILLLSLPHLLSHPPTHKHHSRSNFLSLFALRKYLLLPHLESNLECRAWTELAETGLRIGLHVLGVEEEVEKAVTKAVSPSIASNSTR